MYGSKEKPKVILEGLGMNLDVAHGLFNSRIRDMLVLC
jgi:hypothetical protein